MKALQYNYVERFGNIKLYGFFEAILTVIDQSCTLVLAYMYYGGGNHKALYFS